MARLLQANDALSDAIDINGGLEALIELMRSAKDIDGPNLTQLADLVWSVQKDMASALDNLARSLKD